MSALREDLLLGNPIALAGVVRETIRDALRDAGARLEQLPGGLDEESAAQWARARVPLRVLVFDAQAAFGSGGSAGLRDALEAAWQSVRAVANGAMIPEGALAKIALVGPRPDAGPYAQATRSALENLARTLSVEWARYQLRVVAVMPGEQATDHQLAELVCFLASPAGGYFSGCCLDLGMVPPRAAR